MVHNYTNVNKMNFHLFPQLVEHKMTRDYEVENPSPGLGHAQKDGGVGSESG